MTSLSCELVAASCLRHGVGFLLMDGTRLLAIGQPTIGFRGLMASTTSAPAYSILQSRSSFHSVFRAAGLRTPRHRLVDAGDWKAASAFADSAGLPISVYPRRRADQPDPVLDLKDTEHLRHTFESYLRESSDWLSIEQSPPGQRIRALLLSGSILMTIRAHGTADGSPDHDRRWRTEAITPKDRRFVTRAARAFPGLDLLEIEFARDGNGDRVRNTILDATGAPHIESYFSADQTAAKASVDRLVARQLGAASVRQTATPVSVHTTIDGDDSETTVAALAFSRSLDALGVQFHAQPAEDGAARASMRDDPDRLAHACVTAMSSPEVRDVRLTCLLDDEVA